jgi:hypothetical protein
MRRQQQVVTHERPASCKPPRAQTRHRKSMARRPARMIRSQKRLLPPIRGRHPLCDNRTLLDTASGNNNNAGFPASAGRDGRVLAKAILERRMWNITASHLVARLVGASRGRGIYPQASGAAVHFGEVQCSSYGFSLRSVSSSLHT